LGGNRGAFVGITEGKGFSEGKSVGGSNCFGLEGGGENDKSNDEHCGGEKPRESRNWKHFYFLSFGFCPLLL